MSYFDFVRDLRYAVRTLAKKRLFTVSIILTLALGIGANTAIFSIVHAVLLRSLPYKDSDRLVAIWGELKAQRGSKVFASYGDFQRLRAKGQSFEDVAATTWAGAPSQTLMWGGESYRLMVIPVSDNFFSVLGVKPLLGRTFISDDLTSGCAVVLSHTLWQHELGATPDVLTRSLSLNNKNCSIAGVMPEGFTFYPRNDGVWLLITPQSDVGKTATSSVAIVARLRPGVSKGSAQAEAAALHESVAAESPAASWVRDIGPVVYDLQQEFTWMAGRNLRVTLWMLFAAVGAVLLIACVNIAGLLTSHAVERERELAVRTALGCGHARMLRQLLTESLLLALGGGVVGSVVAIASVRYFRMANPVELPPGNPVTVNLVVLAFTGLIAIVAGLVFGLVPAIKAWRIDLNEALKGGGSRIARNWLSSKSGRFLVVAEVGLSMALVMGAVLLIQSMHRLSAAPLGFRSDHLVVTQVTLPTGAYMEPEQRVAFFNRLLANVSLAPGVAATAVSSNRPLLGFGSDAVSIAGKPAPPSEAGDVWSEQVSENYFRSLGVPLVRGREFDSRDRQSAEPAAIVNQRFVQEYFPGEDPIGMQIKLGLPSNPNPWATIVGVVGNLQQTTVYKEMGYDVVPIVYRPMAQGSRQAMWLFVREANDAVNAGPVIRREVKALDSRIPLLDIKTMDDVVFQNLSHARFRTVLLGIFALLALLLAAIGLYGVLTQTVLQRAREIGVRVALGAEPSDVLRLIIGRGFMLALLGIAAGLAASFYLGGYMKSMLYEIQPTDPPTVLVTSIVLLVVTVVATYLPARRATKVDPMIVLKQE